MSFAPAPCARPPRRPHSSWSAAWAVALIWASLAACAPQLEAGQLIKGAYHYALVGPDEREWRRAKFAENDVAWVRESGHVLAFNATCRDHGDPSLDVLTQHLLMGFADKALVSHDTFWLDGRDALRTVHAASLDGVRVELTLVVLKKDECVNDFAYVAPYGRAAEQRPQFEALVASFAQRRR